MDKTLIVFSGFIEIDPQKEVIVTAMTIDTTVKGETEKRKHLFDIPFPKEINEEYKNKVMDIILNGIFQEQKP